MTGARCLSFSGNSVFSPEVDTSYTSLFPRDMIQDINSLCTAKRYECGFLEYLFCYAKLSYKWS